CSESRPRSRGMTSASCVTRRRSSTSSRPIRYPRMIERRIVEGSRPSSRQRASRAADFSLNVSRSGVGKFHSAASRAGISRGRRGGGDLRRAPLPATADQQWDLASGERLAQAHDAFFELVEALAPARQRDAKRLVLALVPAGTEAEDQAAARELVHCPRDSAQ